ncbi:MAG: hypothetical protein QXI16_03475 [Sulfolobaceae archaeon]
MDTKTIAIVVVVIVVIFLAYLLFKFLNPYFIKINNIFYVNGSPGTGKDVMSSNYAYKRYLANLRRYKTRYRLYKVFSKKKLNTLEKPIFYSSIPFLIRYSKKAKKRIISKPLTLDMLLLKKRMPNGSVVYISDLNRFINQYEYTNPNLINNVSEFITEFRQYTKGGYFICNSQATSQIPKEIRNTFGQARTNLSFKVYLGFIYRINGRNITISDDVINTETGDNDNVNNSTNVWGFFNPFIKRYDTYAYYGRVHDMSIENPKQYEYSNTNNFLKLPKKQENPNTIDHYGTYLKTFKFNKLKYFLSLGFMVILALILDIITGLGLFTISMLSIYMLFLYDVYH